jgi:hypothetical protein
VAEVINIHFQVLTGHKYLTQVLAVGNQGISTHGLYTSLHNLIIVDIPRHLVVTLYSLL